MPGGPQNNSRKGRGYYKTAKGYLRVTRRGLDRGKLVHRLVVERLCRVYCFYGSSGIPEGFDVHHVDFDKTHNCPSNLILIDHTLHYYADSDERRELDGRYHTAQVPKHPPSGFIYLYEYFPCPDCGRVREVPTAMEWAESVPDWLLENTA